jgi:mRNA-degrading endonuclease RelE of RelBE toxin-antitoxin system
MERKIRTIEFKNEYFMQFFDSLDLKSRIKIKEVLYMICNIKWTPEKFMKHIQGVKGLYEIRVTTWDGNYRIIRQFKNEKRLILICYAIKIF